MLKQLQHHQLETFVHVVIITLSLLQVSNSDGDLRRTLVNSSVVEQPRALTLMPGERYGVPIIPFVFLNSPLAPCVLSCMCCFS